MIFDPFIHPSRLRLQYREERILALIMMMQRVGCVHLRDGRILGYHEEGGEGGEGEWVVVLLHGMTESRLGWPSMDCCRDNARVLCVDRPGYGDSSDPPPDYSYSRFAMDMKELLDDLEVFENLVILGHSSGGPCALACSLLHGEYSVVLRRRRLISKIVLVGSDAEYAHPLRPRGAFKDPFSIQWAEWTPISVQYYIQLYYLLKGVDDACDPEKREELAKSLYTEKEYNLYWKQLKEKISASYEHSLLVKGAKTKRTAGVLNDYRLERSRYDFDVSSMSGSGENMAIPILPVDIWCPEEDHFCVPNQGKFILSLLDQRFFNPKLYLVENEGHFSVLYNPDSWNRIITTALQACNKS